MITISLFILFILYTLACIADGPDIKPILNIKIGQYLHRQADKFYRAHYCHIDMCPFPHRFLSEGYQNAIPVIEPIGYDMELISHTVRLNEEEVYYFKSRGSNINIIDRSKRVCIAAICKVIENRINFSIDDNNPDGCIYINGNIICEKEKKREIIKYYESTICKT